MLTVRLVKYNDTRSQHGPSSVASYSLREVSAIYVRYEADGRCVVQLGDPSPPGSDVQPECVTVGDRKDCEVNVAYVMNHAGKTVDKIF